MTNSWRRVEVVCGRRYVMALNWGAKVLDAEHVAHIHRVLVLAALSAITVRAPSSLTSGRMSEARAKGLSLADAIDISSGSDDDVVPSRRSLAGQAPVSLRGLHRQCLCPLADRR